MGLDDPCRLKWKERKDPECTATYGYILVLTTPARISIHLHHHHFFLRWIFSPVDQHVRETNKQSGTVRSTVTWTTQYNTSPKYLVYYSPVVALSWMELSWDWVTATIVTNYIWDVGWHGSSRWIWIGLRLTEINWRSRMDTWTAPPPPLSASIVHRPSHPQTFY